MGKIYEYDDGLVRSIVPIEEFPHILSIDEILNLFLEKLDIKSGSYSFKLWELFRYARKNNFRSDLDEYLYDEKFVDELSIYYDDLINETIRYQEYDMLKWLCTDTHVGLSVVSIVTWYGSSMETETPLYFKWQVGRKMSPEYRIFKVGYDIFLTNVYIPALKRKAEEKIGDFIL